MSNSIELTTKAGVKIAVNAVVGGNGGGGGVSAHGDLTGLTTGDDHPQYQRSEATYTSSASYTVTDESVVITAGSAVTLPDAEDMAGRLVGVGATAQTVAISPAGTDTMFDDPGNPYSLPAGNGITFVAVQIGGNWGWAVYTRNGPAFDMPKWFGESVAAGEVLRMGASVPEWTNEDPGAYDFLSGTGWTDNVPVVIPCKNTSAGTITKGQAVYVTGTVGSTPVVEVALADCDDAAKMPAIGLAESTMAVNATGYVVVTGVLSGIDTSGFTINGPLYVSTTAGVLTGTKPTGTSELIQNIGRATRINASTGEVVVLGPGRTADVPNAIDAGKLTSGTVATARLGSGTADATTFLRGDQSYAVPAGKATVVGGQGAGSQLNEPSTATSLLTSTVTVPVCAAGDVILFSAGINFTQNSSQTRNVTFAVKLGATTILSSIPAVTNSATARVMHLQGAIRVGSTTAQSASMILSFSTSASGSTGAVNAATGTATEDLASASTLDLLVTATANTTQNYTLQYLNVTKVAA